MSRWREQGNRDVMHRLRHMFVALIVLAGLPDAAEAQSVFTGFKGQLLVASSRMPDPRFANTVIYMFAHSVVGAAGIIVNQPALRLPLAELYRLADISAEAADLVVPVHLGGPVEPEVGFVLHESAIRTDQTLTVDDTLSLTGWHSFLTVVATDALPERAIFTLGFASWGPGQLEREVIEGAWTSRPADPELIFDGEPDRLWERVSESQGSTL